MELKRRRRPSVAALILGHFVLICATAVYLFGFYIAQLSVHDVIPGAPSGPIAFFHHVVLIPGLCPWLLTATWVLTLHLGGTVPKGLGLIVLSIFIHFWIFAASAHSDMAYPWFQGFEFAFTAYCVKSLITDISKPTSIAATRP